MSPTPSRIVYLFGAGSTQAEVGHRGGEIINMLMRDDDSLGEGVSTRVLKNAPKYANLAALGGGVFASPTGEGRDIEKMISLFSATGLSRDREIADELRQSYFRVVVEGLDQSGILAHPDLATMLLEFHADHNLASKEKLAGIISLNHDNLFQVASQQVYGGVNLGFLFSSQVFSTHSGSTPPVLQLHGAFNWRAGNVVQIDGLSSSSQYSDDMEWIPPSILKEYTDYPYNKLNAIAYELLTRECDILRLVGCSLSQNDWNVISLLFNAQYRSLSTGKPFRIELVMTDWEGRRLAKSCSYLYNTVPMSECEGRDFKALKEWKKEDGPSPEASNPFEYWLERKIVQHVRLGELGREWLDRVEAPLRVGN